MNIATLIARCLYNVNKLAQVMSTQPRATELLSISQEISKTHKLVFHTTRNVHGTNEYYHVIVHPNFNGSLTVRVLGDYWETREKIESLVQEWLNEKCNALATAIDTENYDGYADFKEMEKELVDAESSGIVPASPKGWAVAG